MENVHKFPPIINNSTQDYDLVAGKKIGKKVLVNRLNAIHFKDETLLVKFRHIKYNHTMIRRAFPLPCLGDELECVWAEADGSHQDLAAYKFQSILVPQGKKILLVNSEAAGIDEKGIRLLLPNFCSEIGFRKVQRHLCKGVQARLIQNSASFNGVLLEFSPLAFVVECSASPPQTFQWIDSQLPVSVIFFDRNETYYSGTCKILKQSEGRNTGSYVLKPLENQSHRFRPKVFRSTRQLLQPQPNIIFKHPLTQKMESLKVLDLSGSGVAVEELEDIAVLLPGIIVPEVELNFAGSFKLSCKMQVVYRKRVDEAEENKSRLKYGLALLDAGIEEHRRLLALLHQASDGNSYLSGHVDVDNLWDFFFEAGFIYPQKYNFIQENKKKIKETYRKLYTSNPTIARHFIYQDKNRILGHMSMVRFYENSWLLQHHIAITSRSNWAGLAVLNQAGRFINDSQRLFSVHMNYVFCYFRPENKFPERIFGGICKHIKDLKGCSLDTFAYFHYRKGLSKNFEKGDIWSIEKTQPDDLRELKGFYEHISGGLMLNALELETDMLNIEKLIGEFQRLGLKRERHLFSLKKNNSLKAVVMANISDIGLNLSDLTNCIQAIIVDPDNLPREIFYEMLSQIATKYEIEEIPILLYPVIYAKNHSIAYEKLYTLWALNMQYTDHYFRYLKRLLRFIQH